MKNLKILVADGNATLRSEIYAALSRREEVESCRCVAGGAEALECLNNGDYDVLLLDLVLSQTDGFAVMEQACQLPKPPKIIVMTALSQDDVVQKACTFGIYYYFVKPFNMDSLISRVIETPAQVPAVEKPALRLPERLPPVKSLDERIANVFLAVGIPAHIKGYHFLREAVKQVYSDRSIINSITKELYPGVARTFDTTASKVERAIRHAIEVAWARGKIENINGIFGYTIYGKQEKPTNGEFIALVADKLLIDDLTRSEQSKAV